MQKQFRVAKNLAIVQHKRAVYFVRFIKYVNKTTCTPTLPNYTNTTNMICTGFTIAYKHLAGTRQSLYDIEGPNIVFILSRYT